MKRGFVEDGAGDLSLMRLMMMVVVLVVLGVWVWGCIAAGRYIPLGSTEGAVIAAAFGGKSAQSWVENKYTDGA